MFGVLLWHDKSLPCTEKDTVKGKKCLELCLWHKRAGISNTMMLHLNL